MISFVCCSSNYLPFCLFLMFVRLRSLPCVTRPNGCRVATDILSSRSGEFEDTVYDRSAEPGFW